MLLGRLPALCPLEELLNTDNKEIIFTKEFNKLLILSSLYDRVFTSNPKKLMQDLLHIWRLLTSFQGDTAAQILKAFLGLSS